MVKRKNKREVIPTETIIKKLTEVINNLGNKIPIDRVYLFGSYAKGIPKPYSDVDIAVVSPVFGKDYINETVFLMEEFADTGLIVEPHVFTRDEYNQAIEGTFLYNEVIQKGMLLTQTTGI
ncbi:MAG: Nucleotidyltransferase domain protein [Pelotomaculum sp. PtaB.Bin013]|uniref:Nucleotidyltransferase domain-containing protein n=1 Tax=Pelotomaculum isophthalicicum JI TaxID=947010 RepID=A0A9X4JSL5_9FIRM|nr:nucleotidyltransferase domain-containing protein [Pelotomaculum isophthalicicum]MDF9406759.1 nucleotidyltransferase domain-containing protein [Pelotomaculum isophthalicicum JI]OPX89713.1 MAG: Nucleotidyltransferase domain protein [Pelotomaculum sp. PtaB.Bin013]